MANRYAPRSPQTADQTDALEFHRGNILMNVASTYKKLHQTIQEIVQNGIDAGADRLVVVIDWKQRELIVVDNGEGTTPAQFRTALGSVGSTIKDRSKLGRFGLGLLAPLSKCTSFTFTSRVRGQRRCTRWTFKAADIRTQETEVNIPRESLRDMAPLPPRFTDFAAGEFDVVFQTQVYMRGVTQDRVIGAIDLDELAYNIRNKFSIPMRERKIMVRLVIQYTDGKRQMLDVSARDYNGEPLPVVQEYELPAGRVEFELYRARRSASGRREGEVSVMQTGDTSIVTFREFAAQAKRRGKGDILSDAMQVLNSGYFEGVIRCENVTLLVNRKGFEDNECLEMLYLVIDQWYEKHGKAYFTAEQDETRQSRWMEAGLKVLNRIESIREDPHFQGLFENLREAIDFGSLGEGHSTPKHGEPDGPEEGKTIRNRGGVGTPRNPKGRISDPAPRDHGPKENPDDLPLTIRTPAGSKRRLIKGDSEGLRLATDQMLNDSRLWVFDFRDGTVTFNTLHPIWVRLDETNGKHLVKNAKWIVDLQFWIVYEVLHHLAFFPDREEFEARRYLIDDKVGSHVDAFIVGGAK